MSTTVFLILGAIGVILTHFVVKNFDEMVDEMSEVLAVISVIIVFGFALVVYPLAANTMATGTIRSEELLEKDSLYMVLGQPYCYQYKDRDDKDKNECLVILQKDDDVRLFRISNKKASDIPHLFFWRKDAKIEAVK